MTAEARTSLLQRSPPHPASYAAVAALALLVGLVPRLLIAGIPYYPDAALYLVAGLEGVPDFHLAFRYVGIAPIAIIGLFTDDPFIVTQAHGVAIAALMAAALGYLCRVLELSVAEALITLTLAMLLTDTVAYSGWVPLTDTSFAITTILACAAYIRWQAGRCHDAWLGLALALMLGTRSIGLGIVLSLLLLLPWKHRGWSPCFRVAGWTAGGFVAYAVVAGLFAAGNPLWIAEATIDLFSFQAGPPRGPRDETLTSLGMLFTAPRLAALFWCVVYCALDEANRTRMRPLFVVAAATVVSLDLIDALSENIVARDRRLIPAILLTLPCYAALLCRRFRPAAALTLTGLLCLVLLWAALGPEYDLPSIWPWLAMTKAPAFAKGVLALCAIAALIMLTTKRTTALAVSVWVALMMYEPRDMHHATMARRRNRTAFMDWMTALPRCPVALVRPGVPLDEAVWRFNILFRPSCHERRDVRNARDAARAADGMTTFVGRFEHVEGFEADRRHFLRGATVFTRSTVHIP